MTKLTYTVLISLLFAASICHAQSAVPRDTVITLQRFADAFGNGNDYKLTINSDGLVAFKRFANPALDQSDPRSRASKPVETKISVENVAMLVSEFERIKFFSLNDRYAKIEDGCPAQLNDQGGAETSITINGKTKTISHYYGCRKGLFEPVYPTELTALEIKIDEIVGTKQLLKP